MKRAILVACLSVFCLIPAMWGEVSASDEAADGNQSTVDAVAPVAGDRGAAKASGKAQMETGEETEAEADVPVQADVHAAQQEGVGAMDHKAAVGPANTQKKFDMDALIERIRESHVIGIFTKLALRSDALDMVDLFKAYRRQANHITLDELRARFDGLLLKTLALLDDDPALSREISMSREGIWKSLLEVKV